MDGQMMMFSHQLNGSGPDRMLTNRALIVGHLNLKKYYIVILIL